MTTREEFNAYARDLLVTLREWAEMARVPVATVKQWQTRTDLYPDFPAPMIGPPRVRSPLWWKPDVREWMRARGLPGGTTRPDARRVPTKDRPPPAEVDRHREAQLQAAEDQRAQIAANLARVRDHKASEQDRKEQLLRDMGRVRSGVPGPEPGPDAGRGPDWAALDREAEAAELAGHEGDEDR